MANIRTHRKLTTHVDLPKGRQRRMMELVLYIADKCQSDPTFGATKLNKILFWADFMAFSRNRIPVTGVEYQRLENGPAPRAMLPVRREMVDAGLIVLRSSDYHGLRQDRVIALRDPDLTIFDGRDIAIVDHVIEALWGKTARETSRISHGPWWHVTHDGDTIPYEYAFLSQEPITEGDIERTGELARELGWQTKQVA